jgi:hypothetical protein
MGLVLGSHLGLARGQEVAAKESEPQGPSVKQVQLGFDGRYKVGCWTPVTISVSAGDDQFVGSLFVETPDGDGETTRITAETAADARRDPPIVVPAGGETTVVRHVKIGRMHDPELSVILADGQKEMVRKRLTVSPQADQDAISYPLEVTNELIVTVGPGINITSNKPAENDPLAGRQTHLVGLTNVGSLPTRWYGYEGVDTLVLTTSEPELYRELQENSRIEAIEGWVRNGGRLILCVGAQAPEILAPEHPLARFSPGQYIESVTLPATTALETYAGSAPIEWTARPSVPRLENVAGKIEITDSQTRLPLAVRSAFGMGEVIFIAFDLDRAPLNRWAGQSRLLDRLLDREATPIQEDNAPFGGQTATIGYTDIAGQLRAALDQFDGIRTVSFSFVAMLVIAYIILIGPVDYFLVKKVLKRPELTWVTFPTMVVLVSLAAYGLANYFKGDQLRVNQFDVVDLDDATGRVRGTTCFNIFSPQPETYSLGLSTQILGSESRPDTVLSWFGLPGSAMGGMGSRSVATLFQRPYTIAPDAGAIREVPIQVWSTKAFMARWEMAATDRVASELVNTPGGFRAKIAGTIVNPFAIPLIECYLFFGEAAYHLGNLDPGATATIDSRTAPQSATTRLTRAEKSLEKELRIDVTEKYRRESTEIDRIADALMFYRLAGGHGFADGLHADYFEFLDSSRLLAAGRAVLIGKGPPSKAAAQILRDGSPMGTAQDRRWAYYRVVIPVQEAEKRN